MNALRTAAESVGEPMTIQKYSAWRTDRSGEIPTAQTIANSDIGPWADACRVAGVTPGGQKPPAYTRSELIAAIQRAAEAVGEPLTTAQYKQWRSESADQQPATPSVSSIYRSDIGPWATACEVADVDPGPDVPANTVDRTSIIDALQQSASEVGEPLTTEKYRAWRDGVDSKPPSMTAVYSMFASWGDACDAADVTHTNASIVPNK
jgi:hypothetical protein